MKKQQSGFTLIELIMVIVILGILAATAIPKFIDLSDDAELAAVQGVAGGLTSASAVNLGSSYLGHGVSTDGMACNAAAAAVMEGGFPTTYAMTDGGTLSSALTTTTCVVTRTGGGGNASTATIHWAVP